SKNPTAEEELIIVEGYKTVCPHFVDKYELLMSGKDSDDYLQDNYGSGVTNDNTIYCRICGEQIIKKSSVEIAWANSPKIDIREDLMEFIWKLASYIIRSNIEFDPPRTSQITNRFISNVSRISYPYVS